MRRFFIGTKLEKGTGAIMCLKFIVGFTLFLLVQGNSLKAQVGRITDYNTIAWFQLGAEMEFNKKWGLHIDANSRRVDFMKNSMQTLFRSGVNYRASEKVLLRAGFAIALNSPYGDYTVNPYGKPFNERRLFEMVSIADKVGRVDINHRFMLEQRWGKSIVKPIWMSLMKQPTRIGSGTWFGFRNQLRKIQCKKIIHTWQYMMN